MTQKPVPPLRLSATDVTPGPTQIALKWAAVLCLKCSMLCHVADESVMSLVEMFSLQYIRYQTKRATNQNSGHNQPAKTSHFGIIPHTEMHMGQTSGLELTLVLTREDTIVRGNRD